MDDQEIWPNFFIVGAPRTSTTSLYNYLKQVSKIFLSPIKEPNYFNASTISAGHKVKPIQDKKNYLHLFNDVKNEKIIGEASVWYLADPKAPYLIHQQCPNAKILISLRDPVERVYSHFMMHVPGLWSISSFHEKLQNELRDGTDFNKPNMGIRRGLYHDDIKRYLDVFDPEQVKISIFEEFILDPKKALKDILHFLELDECIDECEGINYQQFFARAQESKPIMDKTDRTNLTNFYSKDVEKLELLLKRRLPWQNFQNEKVT